MKKIIFSSALTLGILFSGFAQKTDTVRPAKENTVPVYFIISAGTVINAYFRDKPLDIETVEQFSSYVQANKKILVSSWVVVTGKPKTGTFDDVIKILARNRFQHVEKNITKD